MAFENTVPKKRSNHSKIIISALQSTCSYKYQAHLLYNVEMIILNSHICFSYRVSSPPSPLVAGVTPSPLVARVPHPSPLVAGVPPPSPLVAGVTPTLPPSGGCPPTPPP